MLDVRGDMTMLETVVNRPIASLIHRDIETAFAHLTTVFGLGPGELVRDPSGAIVHAEVEVGSGTVWLHPEFAEFDLASTATMVVLVDDVDAHHQFAAAHGATIRYEPTDMEYGYCEYGALDGEGHLWSSMRLLDA